MAEKPLPEPGIPKNLFQISSLNIRPVSCTAQQNLRAGRAAVSHDEIHGIAICRQIPAPLLHLLLRGKLLLPPAHMINTIGKLSLIQFFLLDLKVRILRLQNAPVNVMAPGSAECKNTPAINLKLFETAFEIIFGGKHTGN